VKFQSYLRIYCSSSLCYFPTYTTSLSQILGSKILWNSGEWKNTSLEFIDHLQILPTAQTFQHITDLYIILTKSVAPQHQDSSHFSLEPGTCPYPEPAESTPNTPSHSPYGPLGPILSCSPWSTVRSLSFRLFHQNLVYLSLITHFHQLPRPPLSPCHFFVFKFICLMISRDEF
jgi:hypothetical protein